MSIALFSLTSSLHRETASDVFSEPFIASLISALGEEFEYFGSDFTSYGTHESDLIYIRTGGTEGLFRDLGLKDHIKLLTSGQSNSLAASMEILAYLRSHGQSGEILHGNPNSIAQRIRSSSRAGAITFPFVRKLPPVDLNGMRLGVIGAPSDWLIASDVDYSLVDGRMNALLIDIPLSELLLRMKDFNGDSRSFEGSIAIYDSLKSIVADYSLDGLTLRCFDLLVTLHNTGCLALARLNAEGIPASCEGDIPALLTMAWQQKANACPGFQCNLSRIDGDELVFAHCTAPLSMLRHYSYATHFESGIGTAIKGEMECREVRIVKIAPDLDSVVEIPGRIISCPSEPLLCRTQIRVSSPGASSYFLNAPLANHHIISYVGK